MAPKVLIEFPMEAAPQVRIVCMGQTEERRLWDWILAHGTYCEVLERALELTEGREAA